MFRMYVGGRAIDSSQLPYHVLKPDLRYGDVVYNATDCKFWAQKLGKYFLVWEILL